MSEIIEKVRKSLLANANPKLRDSSDRFFKEQILLYGVSTAKVKIIATEIFNDIRDLPKEEIFALCEEFLQSDYSEEAWIAFEWSHKVKKQYVPKDFEIFERWINRYVNNWAKCDTLCNHTIGTFLEMYPQFKGELLKWSKSDNRWFRRAAAVSLVLPARRGRFLSDVIKIADILLTDEDDLVQKGYGWMLKEASKSHLNEVFDYISKHKSRMPRTALRYAIEKMPKDLKDQAMAK